MLIVLAALIISGSTYPANIKLSSLVFTASFTGDFEEKIKLFFDGKLKDLTSNAYSVAKQRDINLSSFL